MTEKDEDPGQRSAWVTAGLWLTALYTIGFLVAVWSPWAEPGRGIVKQDAALTLNEVGDLLAGAFAPLAFLWLLVAVMVQAQELRLQRKELQLTRQEFAESRQVAEAQAAEAKKQAEFIGEQTEMLKASAEQAAKERAAAAAITLARLLCERVRERMPTAARSMFGQEAGEFGRVRQIREYLLGIGRRPLAEVRDDISVETLEYIVQAARRLVELAPVATPQVQIAIYDAAPEQLKTQAERLLARLQNPEEMPGLGIRLPPGSGAI